MPGLSTAMSRGFSRADFGKVLARYCCVDLFARERTALAD
jgi:hypothetical protein